jgi:hypothetical protein
MSDTSNNPQPVDPPVNTGGGTTTSGEPEDDESSEAQAIDPPVNTGGGGS